MGIDTAELLGEVPFFELLDQDERTALAARVHTVDIPTGQTVFSAGDPGESLYIIAKGEVEIFFKNDTGERIVLETIGARAFFGEISLLDNGPRTASVVVTQDLHAVVVDRHDLDEFLQKHPAAALDMLTATGRRLRQTAQLLRHTASRNVNKEIEDNRTTVMKVADWISDFSGSLPFLFIHIGWFAVWILWNLGAVPGLKAFDPYPFGFLTMIVSLEAIVLSVFVLLSQNRQVARDRVQRDIEYDVNLKAELEIAHLHEKVDHLHGELLARLAQIDKLVAPPGSKRA